MLMCSFVIFYFVFEHLFTFQFCAMMPKISKENFAKILVVFTTKAWPLNPGKALVVQNFQKNHKIA